MLPYQKVIAKKRGIFPGWYVTAAAFWAQVAYSQHMSSILGIFLGSMAKDFGLSRTAFSFISTLARLSEGLFAPLLGSILDRQGARNIILFGGIVSGVTFLILSQANTTWQLFILIAGFSSLGMVCLSSMVTGVAISNWFVRMRGRAIGLAITGMSFGMFIWPILITLVIVNWDWRWAWVMLGLTSFLLVLPALPLRRRPEDVGLYPDGAAGPPSQARLPQGSTSASPAQEQTWARREVLKTSTFWYVVFVVAINHFIGTGFGFHFFSFLTDKGVPKTTTATIFSVWAVFLFMASLIWGLLLERLNIKLVVLAKFLTLSTALLMFMATGNIFLIFVTTAIYGFASGGTGVIQDYIWAHYYGRLSLGIVISLGFPVSISLGALGPLFLGLVWDRTGSYDWGLGVIIGLLILCALLFQFCPPPRKTAAASQV